MCRASLPIWVDVCGCGFFFGWFECVCFKQSIKDASLASTICQARVWRSIKHKCSRGNTLYCSFSILYYIFNLLYSLYYTVHCDAKWVIIINCCAPRKHGHGMRLAPPASIRNALRACAEQDLQPSRATQTQPHTFAKRASHASSCAPRAINY